MYDTPVVSVIIPVYNAEKHLPQCIDSVLGQTLREIEIICVDDGSTDRSPMILREYSDRDPRLKVITQRNLYAGAARNKGMDAAEGRYMLFLDSDDFFESTMLDDAVRLMERDTADVCIFGAWRYHEGLHRDIEYGSLVRSHSYPSRSPFAAKNVADHVFRLTDPCPWNKLFRTDYIRRLGIRFQALHNTNDLYFVYSAIAMAERITWTTTPYVHYRVAQGTSVQDNKVKHPFDFYFALKELQNELIKRGVYQEYRSSFRVCVIETFNYNLPRLEGKDFFDLSEEQFVTKYIDTPVLYMPAPRYNDTGEIPSVSVVVSLHNAAEYLADQLKNLLDQTLDNIEVICINDGSYDHTLSLLLGYAQADGRIAIVSQPFKGMAASMNIGMSRAHGKYLYFIDRGGMLAENAFEVLVSLAEDAHTELLMFRRQRDTTNDMAIERHSQLQASSLYPKALRSGRELITEYLEIGGYHPEVGLQFYSGDFLSDNDSRFLDGVDHEDELFSTILLPKVKRALVCPDELYRGRAESVIPSPCAYRRFQGRFICYVRLMSEATGYDPADTAVHCFLIQRARYNLDTARKTHSLLSDEEKKYVFPSGYLEYSQMYRDMFAAQHVIDRIQRSIAYRILQKMKATKRMIRNRGMAILRKWRDR